MDRLRSHGFTLIELLIVVVVIGILAAIAIPKFSRSRENAMIASVMSDLKILASQQEAYQSQTQQYAANVSDLTNFSASEGVIVSVNDVDLGRGWAATAYHIALPGRPCGIFYGTGNPASASPATQAGLVTCTP